MAYVIDCRYEYWGPRGVVWTDWFPMFREYKTLADAQEVLKRLMAQKPINKLHHKYRLK